MPANHPTSTIYSPQDSGKALFLSKLFSHIKSGEISTTWEPCVKGAYISPWKMLPACAHRDLQHHSQVSVSSLLMVL